MTTEYLELMAKFESGDDMTEEEIANLETYEPGIRRIWEATQEEDALIRPED